MKVLKIIGIVLCVLVVLILGFLAWAGMFASVKAVEQEMGPYTMAYDSFVGPYKDTGMIFQKVDQSLRKDGIVASRGIGIYYDDPQSVPANQLRSECGSIIEDKNLAALEKVKANYKIKTVAKSACLVVEFPARTMMAYMIGPMKAYPVLTAAAKAKSLRPSLMYEIYDMPGKKIFYVMAF
jgi:hypothetical protein